MSIQTPLHQHVLGTKKRLSTSVGRDGTVVLRIDGSSRAPKHEKALDWLYDLCLYGAVGGACYCTLIYWHESVGRMLVAIALCFTCAAAAYWLLKDLFNQSPAWHLSMSVVRLPHGEVIPLVHIVGFSLQPMSHEARREAEHLSKLQRRAAFSRNKSAQRSLSERRRIYANAMRVLMVTRFGPVRLIEVSRPEEAEEICTALNAAKIYLDGLRGDTNGVTGDPRHQYRNGPGSLR